MHIGQRKLRMQVHDLLPGQPTRQQVEYGRNLDASAFDARFAGADIRVNGYTVDG
jgi:hypothetical protein